MKNKIALYPVMIFVCMLFNFNISAQENPEPLPKQWFQTMLDSTNSIDVVIFQGEGSSLSIDGKSVKFFNSLFENKPTPKTNVPIAGTIMWLINGREFISGNYFIGDSTGYVVYQKDNHEFVNQINEQGNAFFKSKFKE